MEYMFLERGPEALAALADMPTSGCIAVAVRTTGYDLESDEVVELAVSDMEGKSLFSRRVKPQNAEGWQASDASGGIAPEDVEEAPELFQFEDELRDLFEQAEAVVFSNARFAERAIEASWVSLAAFESVDLVELFRQSHCSPVRPDEPATAASLLTVASYYGIGAPDGTAEGEAACIASCYRALVAEHVRERDEKPAAYWQRFEEEQAEERAKQEHAQALYQKREHRLNQMNGLLWFVGGIIFTSLGIQIYQGHGDMGAVLIAGVIAVFCFIRGVVNMRK